MLPLKTLLQIDRASKTPLYLQVCNALIKQINFGAIPPGYKLPGTRKLARTLEMNRRTVTLAFEELESQGWLEIRANSGCYVSSILPKLAAQKLTRSASSTSNKYLSVENSTRLEKTAFTLPNEQAFIEEFVPTQITGDHLTIDAGYPDIRITPLKSLVRNLNSIVSGNRSRRLFNYTASFCGDIQLRSELKSHLRNTRSIQVDEENIMITRGSLMAFHNIFRVILKPGDKVVVGRPGFHVINHIIRIAGGQIVEVPVDQFGIDVTQIETVCKTQNIKAVFIMPHHHNPTTVSLSAQRRMQLLSLAKTFGFAIIEDDYDYDFHYQRSPILPMASTDKEGSVVYVGSLSKTIAPGLRMGFIVAPKNLVRHLARLSRCLDCHGNIALERAVAILFNDGEINRYMKKSLKIYRQRRDYFCALLKNELGDMIEFEVPEGGMAVWVKFDSRFVLTELRKKTAQKGLLMSKSVFHDVADNPLNAIRMGFASLNEFEAEKAIGILKEIVRSDLY